MRYLSSELHAKESFRTLKVSLFIGRRLGRKNLKTVAELNNQQKTFRVPNKPSKYLTKLSNTMLPNYRDQKLFAL